MSFSETWKETYEQVMVPNYAPLSVLPQKGQGSKLWDVDGKEYIDLAGGIAVSALGHANPELIEALIQQAKKFWHLSNVLTNEPAIKLAKILCESTFAEKVFFANSGSEVNEAALKLARRYAVDHFSEDKYEILAFDHAFHGRTFFAVSVGGQPKYSSGFGPNPAGISHIPFNDEQAVLDYFSVKGDRVCAVILEPCQGESGVIPAIPTFLNTLRQCCDQHNALLIFDEVQTGVGRSGDLYTYQQMGVTPDILTSAKALGCGFPIAAMLTTEKIANSFSVGTHGSTFGGNPMACAVACKVLEIINEPLLLQGVKDKHNQLVKGLSQINENYQVFDDIRGIGLLLGCQLSGKYENKARDVMTACVEKGLFILVAGTNVLRIAPALNIGAQEIEHGLSILDQVFNQMEQS